jgi:hypothetical protein
VDGIFRGWHGGDQREGDFETGKDCGMKQVSADEGKDGHALPTIVVRVEAISY